MTQHIDPIRRPDRLGGSLKSRRVTSSAVSSPGLASRHKQLTHKFATGHGRCSRRRCGPCCGRLGWRWRRRRPSTRATPARWPPTWTWAAPPPWSWSAATAPSLRRSRRVPAACLLWLDTHAPNVGHSLESRSPELAQPPSAVLNAHWTCRMRTLQQPDPHGNGPAALHFALDSPVPHTQRQGCPRRVCSGGPTGRRR